MTQSEINAVVNSARARLHDYRHRGGPERAAALADDVPRLLDIIDALLTETKASE